MYHKVLKKTLKNDTTEGETMVNEQKQTLKMKDDIMFKAFFSKIGNEDLLKELLSAILREDVKIKKVIHDARLEQLAKENKYGILDLEVELENKEIINVEMQLKDYHNIEERTTFYASKKISEQLTPNQDYSEIKKVIVIAILNYSFIDLPEYITDTIRVAKDNRQYELNNKVRYIYIELEKFRKQNPDMKDALNQWLAFLDMERGDLLEMAMKENEKINEAVKKYNELTGDAEVKRLAEVRLMAQLEENAALASARAKGVEKGLKEGVEKGLKEGVEKGLKEGVEKGLKEGVEKGLKEGVKKGLKEGLEKGKKDEKVKIARKLLKLKIPISQIKEITGLSEEQVRKIR